MSGLTTGLVRRDLLDLEQRLRDSLYRVLPFEAHAVYFPRQTRSKEPEWLGGGGVGKGVGTNGRSSGTGNSLACSWPVCPTPSA